VAFFLRPCAAAQFSDARKTWHNLAVNPVRFTYSGRTVMAAYMLLCNFTDQGVRTIKDALKRRKAARELAKKLGVEIKTGYLAIGPYDLVIHVEAPNDEALATYLLSLASKGNVRTTTLKVFAEAEFDKIVGKVA
jgi:uncharacterized protein with GYD domain